MGPREYGAIRDLSEKKNGKDLKAVAFEGLSAKHTEFDDY